MDDTDLKTTLEIHLIRQYIKVSDLKAAYKQIDYLTPFSKKFSEKQQYYWNKFIGNVYSLDSNLIEAYTMYLTAEAISHHVHFSENELADLYYSISVTCSGLRKTADSIFYANKALSIYQRRYNIKRCSQCHITLGINFRRIKKYEEAIKHYNSSIKLAMTINDSVQIHLAHMNLGHLYSVIGNSNMAISLFEEILSSPYPIQQEDKLLTILSLVKEYNKKNEFVLMKQWILKGCHIIHTTGQKHEGIKLELLAHSHLLADDYEQLELVIKQNLIPYFQSLNDFAKVAFYSELLFSYFGEKKLFEKAWEYGSLANLAYKKITTI